jgi:hypothetical protein
MKNLKSLLPLALIAFSLLTISCGNEDEDAVVSPEGELVINGTKYPLSKLFVVNMHDVESDGNNNFYRLVDNRF